MTGSSNRNLYGYHYRPLLRYRFKKLYREIIADVDDVLNCLKSYDVDDDDYFYYLAEIDKSLNIIWEVNGLEK